MENTPQPKSLLNVISDFVEFSNRHFTLSKWIFTSKRTVFFELEIMTVALSLLFLVLLFNLEFIPPKAAIVIAVLLSQRVFEFLVVYSRNFIFRRGRIFSHFHDPEKQGQWLLMMFFLNIIQIVFVFSIWYRLISFLEPGAFTQKMGAFDSLYFSATTFLTIGYGDITPIATLPRGLVLLQGFITFYVIVIVINGLISIHFKK